MENCEETMKRIPSGSIDLILQDPPYGTTQNDWDIKPDLQRMWFEWERIIKDNGAIIFTASQPFSSELVLSRSELFRYDLIWHKPLCSGFLNASKMPLRNHEHILVFYKKLPVYNPIMGAGKNKKGKSTKTTNGSNYGSFTAKEGYKFDDKGLRYPTSVLTVSNGNRNHNENYHPTQKPVDLMRYLISTYSNVGETVFDGYSGSGTTAVACVKEQRCFIGAEINHDYFEKSIKRIEREMSQLVLF